MDGLRRSRIRLALVIALAMLVGTGWVATSVSRASRYAHRLEASGVAPYAPDGWVADSGGTVARGRLTYAMHDRSGRHVSVAVSLPRGGEHSLEPYQQALLKRYGVVISIRIARDPDPDGMLLPGAIGAELSPQDARWLADRLCWPCRFAGGLTGAGVLFG